MFDDESKKSNFFKQFDELIKKFTNKKSDLFEYEPKESKEQLTEELFLLTEAQKVYSETYDIKNSLKMPPGVYEVIDAKGNIIAYSWIEKKKAIFITNEDPSIVAKRMN